MEQSQQHCMTEGPTRQTNRGLMELRSKDGLNARFLAMLASFERGGGRGGPLAHSLTDSYKAARERRHARRRNSQSAAVRSHVPIPLCSFACRRPSV